MAPIRRVPIKNFSRTSGTIFRGGVPDAAGLEFLSGLGIKTIVDLRASNQSTLDECAMAARQGFSYFNIPTGYCKIPDGIISAFLAVCLQPRYQPLYVHCHDGTARTAALIAIYRIAVDGWPLNWAYTEMLDKGFRPWQLLLRHSVSQFSARMTPLNFQQRLWALQELVEANTFSIQ